MFQWHFQILPIVVVGLGVVFSSEKENAIVDHPDVVCSQDGITFDMETVKPFKG